MGDLSLWDAFERGGPVMWPLLGASILAVSLLFDRAFVFIWWFQTLPGVVRKLRPLVTEGDWRAAEKWCTRRGPLTYLARIYLQQRDQPKEIREDVLAREGSLLLGHLENRLRWLAILAQISTLLGLLGTFHVMIIKFYQGQASGKAMSPDDFSSAIWEAFLTTMFGLAIAIPCSAAYQFFEGRLDKIGREMGAIVSYLDEWRRSADTTRQSVGGEVALRAPAVPKQR